MSDGENRILPKMLDRLFAGLLNGPSMNCRPHHSRQRIDLTHIGRLEDTSAEEMLLGLLGRERASKAIAQVPPPKVSKPVAEKDEPPSVSAADDSSNTSESPAATASPSGRFKKKGTNGKSPADDPWTMQQTLLNKFKIIADDAKTYEQDTGVHVLSIGFPLLSLPPSAGSALTGKRGASRRILAPLALIPIKLVLGSRPKATVELSCQADEIDRVVANPALMAWLDQQEGKQIGELFADHDGTEPWQEISEVVRRFANLLGLEVPAVFSQVTLPEPKSLQLAPAPRRDDDESGAAIVLSAVLGLYPVNNQGLLRDMQAMVAGESLEGPVQSFLQAGLSLDAPPPEPVERTDEPPTPGPPRVFTQERLIAAADPCQGEAVRLVRECRGLVVHGPPGTGKSQTITNIIGDHLARGQRVLMVCDKRTALDVVANRLEHLGFGSLVALVHDPQRDQRNLYRSIREQLENLADTQIKAGADRQLSRLDSEISKLHAELTQAHELLQTPDAVEHRSFHQLVGEWLQIESDADEPALAMPAGVSSPTWPEFEEYETDVCDALRKAEQVHYATHPWANCTAGDLDAFLSRPMSEVRAAVQTCVALADATDRTLDLRIPPFDGVIPLASQAEARQKLADRLARIPDQINPLIANHWCAASDGGRQATLQRLVELAPSARLVSEKPLDVELAMMVRHTPPSLRVISQQLAAIETHLANSGKWYGIFCFRARAAANRVLAEYGLPTGNEAAQKLSEFLQGLKARRTLQTVTDDLVGQTSPPDAPLVDDATLTRLYSLHHGVLEVLAAVDDRAPLASLKALVREALVDESAIAALLAGLIKSSDRAAAIQKLLQQLTASGMFRDPWISQVANQFCSGGNARDTLSPLAESLSALEGVLRTRQAIGGLPASLGSLVNKAMEQGQSAEQSLAAIRKHVLAASIVSRLKANPNLQRLDSERLQLAFERYRELDEQKKSTVCDSILHAWVSRQKERLLAPTGSRLNSTGADLKRRLTMRGDRALRLRQVIEVGQNLEGGDPLFDLRPVWMASPETVAQILDRTPRFDVVVFDEASQCRLEEALPVLTRAHRVVIAGDPKQLPPTRFFETAAIASEDEAIETEQQLFELHQGETEDLLSAALGIEIRQCYLDVHYRSTNADLIAFSNEQFYGARLQPIPGHPSNRAIQAPINLCRAGGIYQDRQNPIEADAVCKIVKDLLRRAEPPSIGIACFNVTQRDLIVEKLDELAANDDAFAARLATARSRAGAASFEGLFVKNLENVQGDERDHIIISTTYGPDAQGRFYRRFGPVGSAGGGRRLNVLVTRARQEVHLVTSIPPEVYRALPPIPNGQSATGAWLLFAYLNYAEQLAAKYELISRALDERDHHQREAIENRDEHEHSIIDGDGELQSEPSAGILPPTVVVEPSRTPSVFATALAQHLSRERHWGSSVHWGNDGFCVDIALRHPRYAEDVTIGVLCDTSRFSGARDPVEWDIFRTGMLESQGWKLRRIWSPMYFRDPEGIEKSIAAAANEYLARDDAKDAIRVTKEKSR